MEFFRKHIKLISVIVAVSFLLWTVAAGFMLLLKPDPQPYPQDVQYDYTPQNFSDDVEGTK